MVKQYSYRIRAFRGLHQSPDTDAALRSGEASVQQNFRVTNEGCLRKRGGLHTQCIVREGAPIRALWNGRVQGVEQFLCVCGGQLFRLEEGSRGFTAHTLGEVNCEGKVQLFGFSGKVYVLTGSQYLCYDGDTLSEVEGYAPLVRVSVTAEKPGECLERENLLTPRCRVRLSPDGVSAVFPLGEENITGVLSARNVKTGETYAVSLRPDGSVTFLSPPQKGTNTVEILFEKDKRLRSAVEEMHCAELYNSTQDSRIFLYGDGTNRCIYSDLDEAGLPRADYFPAGNEIRLGDENTPITAMIRHFSTLVGYKTDSAYGVRYGTLSLPDGSATAAFYVTPIHRSLGSEALGEAVLVDNAPRTLCAGGVYEWVNSSSFAAALTVDERQARRISDRVGAHPILVTGEHCHCFDDGFRQEYYIFSSSQAIVHNYACDAWTSYTNFDAECMVSVHGRLFLGGSDGHLRELSDSFPDDDGAPIDCRWESGALELGSLFRRKSSPCCIVSLAPQEESELSVSCRTDAGEESETITLRRTNSVFEALRFDAFSFRQNRESRALRLRLRAKKFVYYKLVLRLCSARSSVTVQGIELRYRSTGEIKEEPWHSTQ